MAIPFEHTKYAVVLGSGESGVGTALLAWQQGYDVFVSDRGTIANQYKQELDAAGIRWEENKHTEEEILKAGIVVKSPGIPDTVPLVVALNTAQIPVISEIEFASWFTEAPLVAITGSNGKTTTTLLTHHILKIEKSELGLAGNIGNSFARSVSEKKCNDFVLEISSFQLDGIVSFAPHIAVLLNITPDHLDRYNYDFQAYVRSKFRITENQKDTDHFVYNADDPVITTYMKENAVKANLWPFSLTQKLDYGTFIKDKHIIMQMENEMMEIPLTELVLQGQHNVANAMAASTVAQLSKIRKRTIREGLGNFQGVEHRLEEVLKINNVRYFNDAKATNVNSVFYALDSMSTPTVWIVGGQDKGNDYSELYELVNEKVKAIICLGVDNSKIINAFDGCVQTIVETQSMAEAVRTAYSLSERGDAVLLSPACASFDLFKDYKDKGKKFKEAVRAL